MAEAQDGWTTVQSNTRHSQAVLDKLSWADRHAYELKVIREWEVNPEVHWSGIGKHISNLSEGKRLHSKFPPADFLGDGSYGHVERVYRSVYLARKHIWYRRGRATDLLRDEVRVMERLDHDHVVRVVGTYAREENTLNILLWPAAVCTLQDLLRDVEDLRTGKGTRAEILKRMAALDLKDLSAVDPKWKPEQLSAPGNCPLRFLREVLGCIAHTVAYCHRREVRHQDLKPTNILLCPGRVYLADFGIARDVHDQDDTMTVGFQGSPKWQAPEALDQEHKWSRNLADVFSLGLIFLNVATVIYGGRLADFEAALKNPYQPERRDDQLKRFREKLVAHALAAEAQAADPARGLDPRTYADVCAESEDAIPTAHPSHVVDLAARMLSRTPSARPKAEAVDEELAVLGGVAQVYHSTCCRRQAHSFAALCLEPRLERARRRTAEDMARLRAERDALQRRVSELEGKEDTFEMRVVNERARAQANQERLQRQLDDQRQLTMALEAKIADLERNQKRPGPGGRAGPARARTDGIEKGAAQRDALGIAPYGQPTRTATHPAPRNAAAAAAGGPGTSTSTKSFAASTVASSMRRIASETMSAATAAPWARQLAAGSPLADPIPRPSTTDATAASTRSIIMPPPSPGPTTPTNGVGYPLRTVPSGSKLPVLARDRRPTMTPSRSNTPTLGAESSNADSTHTSLGSSIFSLRSRETIPTPVEGSPLVGRSSAAEPAATPTKGAIVIPPVVTEVSGLSQTVVPGADAIASAHASPVRAAATVHFPAAAAPGSPPLSPAMSAAAVSVSAASASAPPSSTAPLTSSAFSSPRTTHADLASDGGLGTPRIFPPPMPTGKSWAAVAGDPDGLQKMISSAAREAAAKHKKAVAAAAAAAAKEGAKDVAAARKDGAREGGRREPGRDRGAGGERRPRAG